MPVLPSSIALAAYLSVSFAGSTADSAVPGAPRPIGAPMPAAADSLPRAPLFEAGPSPFAPPAPEPVSAPTPLQAAGASLVLPGLGQWWTGHPVRGSILGVMELWIYGDALQRCLVSIPDLRQERDAILVELRQEESRLASDTTPAAKARLRSLRDSLSDASGRANISTDYVHSEIAWALGLHAWGVVDAAESAWLRRGGKRPVRSMTEAAWASALVPGLGQIRNGRYSKAALLYMGTAGSVVSLVGRQSMVEFWQTESDIASAEGRSTTVAVEQADFFRKRRNQYIWGLGLLYVYQILDAVVDARLSRVETSPSFVLAPSLRGPGLEASLRF